MSRQLAKSAPILIVAAFLGYLCWPYVDNPARRPETAKPGKALESFAAQLAPAAALSLERDPFNSRAVEKTARPAVTEGAKKAPVTGETAKEGPASTGAAKTVVAGAPGEFDLQATHLRGERRVALINGSVYVEGDEIKPSGASAASYTVARIYAHTVVLQGSDQTTVLTYSSRESKPAAGRSTPGTSKGSSGKKSSGPTGSRKTS